MIVYPNPDSWDEFCPSEIFIALSTREDMNSAISEFVKANIGANITIGNSTISQTYKKVGDITRIADLDTSLVILSKAVDKPNG